MLLRPPPESNEILLSRIKSFDNPAYNPDADADGYIAIPINTVAAKVIENADSGHLESKEFLKSIPLFAYLLTGSGTEAVNKAVLDIYAEATDWVLDPANNQIKYKDSDGAADGQYLWRSNKNYSTPDAACRGVISPVAESQGWSHHSIVYNSESSVACMITSPSGSVIFNSTADRVDNPDWTGSPSDEYKYLPIETVAQQVISNANEGHAPSQEALRLSTVERVNTGEYDEALEAASTEIDTSWKYLPIYDVAVQVKRNSIAGHAESIEAVNNSLPFELPNYEPNITITGVAKVGEVLTATVTDENGLPSNINYQWYADGEVISDATSETYVIKESDSGKTITVQADFTDKDGFSESVTGTVDVEVFDTGDMGLRADYSGTGWYKATDTGTVFNKDVPALETHVFSDSPKEYVSVYTKDDAKLYGERAAVSNLTDMSSMFRGDDSFNQDISSWDTSNVTNMSSMFRDATAFNSNISMWDVSSVVNMYFMFYNVSSFNSDISLWNVSSVTDMDFMFNNAASFNQDISSWDVSNVTIMNNMFAGANSFNQDLSEWCVSLIPTMPSYFYSSAVIWTLPKPVWGTCPRHEDGSVPVELSPTGLKADYSGTGWYKATDTGTVFNKGVPALETAVFEEGGLEYVSVYTKEDARLYGERAAVSNMTNMTVLFNYSTSFNQDISSWDVSSVTNMNRMFSGVSSFNQDISSWDVSSVTDMSNMFFGASAFNSDISNWDVSNVTNMNSMFQNAASFNSDISNWNVSNVTYMINMFASAASFNSDTSLWDVSSVTKMDYMFYGATSFNQDLSEWCVQLIVAKPDNFDSYANSWTLPKPVWGTCPRGEVG